MQRCSLFFCLITTSGKFTSRSRRLLCASFLSGLVALAAGCGKSTPASFNSTDITGSTFGKDFALTDHAGKPRTLGDFKGKVVTLFFGYTQCPDVCPTNLSSMAEVMRLLGDDAQRVQVLFMSVDPERDTQQLLAQYVPAFHPAFLGLFADAATTEKTAKEFKVFYKKQAGSTPETYTVDHSAGTYVYDPQGRLRLYVAHGEEPAKVAGDIRQLLQGK